MEKNITIKKQLRFTLVWSILLASLLPVFTITLAANTAAKNFNIPPTKCMEEIATSGLITESTDVSTPLPLPMNGCANALYFDGNNDYINIPTPVTGADNFTFEFWFRADDNSFGNLDRLFIWFASDGRNRFELGEQSGNLRLYTNSGSSVGSFIKDDMWHHVAVTRNGNNIVIYLDGSVDITFSFSYSFGHNISVGRWPGTSTEYWRGPMDEFRIWDYVRSQAEIQATMNTEVDPNSPGLVGYYNCNQGVAGGNNAGINVLEDIALGNGTADNGDMINWALTGPISNWVQGLLSTAGDNTPPTAVCATPTVNLTSDGTTTVDASFFDGGSAATCGGVTLSASMNNFGCSDVGNTYSVTLTVTAQTNNQTSTCTSNVTVEDPNSYCCTPANAVCNNTSVQLDANGMANIMPSDVGGGSTAACGLMTESVMPMNFDCDDLGSPVSVTYTIEDINGATRSCTAAVTVEDNIPPTPVCKTTTIEIQPDGIYNLELEDVFDLTTTTDNCTISGIGFPSASYDCDDDGETVIIPVTTTDVGGNVVSCDATITVTIGDDLPGGWTTTDIGDSGSMGNSTSFDPCTNTDPNAGEFVITGGGNNATSSTTDNVAFAGQSICGDGTITAKVESVDPNGYGGLMIRETTDAGAKQVAIFSNLSNMLRHEVRYMTNGPKQVNSFFKPNPIWLLLERQGSWVFAYYSTNGVAYQYVHAVMVTMQSCVEFGLASFTYQPGQQTNAAFSNVTVTGTPAPNAEVPEITEETPLNLRTTVPLNLTLYPNPANDIVNLTFEDGLNSDAIISLRNQFGQVVEQRELRAGDFTTEWNISMLADGLYLFEIRQENGELRVLKLVKTK